MVHVANCHVAVGTGIIRQPHGDKIILGFVQSQIPAPVLSFCTLQKLNGCFDLVVVILVAVQGNVRSKLRKIKPCHYNFRQFNFQCDVVTIKTGMFVHM